MSTRATFLADQADAAREQALEALMYAAELEDLSRERAPASPWLARLVETYTGVPDHRRRTCKHLSVGSTPQATVLLPYRRRLECLACAAKAMGRTCGTVEDRTCDCCREIMPVGQVLTTSCVVGAVLVSVGHCGDCAGVVRGTGVRAT